MILTCPACGTQYAVKEGAIPPGGRQVRCAACRHSWHQEPEGEAAEQAPPAPPAETRSGEVPDPAFAADGGGREADRLPEEEAAAPDEPMAADVPLAEPPMAPPIPPQEEDSAAFEAVPPHDIEGSLEQRPYEPVDSEADDDFSPFAHREPVEERRRSPLLAVLLVVLLVGAIAAAFWFLAPVEWKQRVGLASASTPLQLMMTHSDRQRLASGNELLAISGRVINPTDEAQTVPPITAQLRNPAGQIVHSWTIAPPAPSLGPGASASFNSTKVDVPAGGDELTVTLGAPRA